MAEVQVADGEVPLNASQLQHLEQVIAELERRTAGEIRLMIVSRSSGYRRVFPTVAAVLLVLVWATIWLERHHLIWWAGVWLVPVVSVLAVLSALALARIPAVIRMVVGNRQLRASALLRAELEFYREGLANTRDRTGILLFLSLLEHQAVVLADRGIASQLEAKIWNEVVQTMLDGPRTGQWSENLEKALRQCGELLATHFPIQAGDHNELSNLVIVKP